MRDRSARAPAAVGPAIVAIVVGIIGVTAIAMFVAVAPAAADGEITIEVMANGTPADSAPGPSVKSGASVNLRYVVTVGSTEPLYDFVVSNETGDTKPSCDIDDDGQPDGTNNHPGPLEAGDSFFCVTSVVTGDPGVTYASVGRVTAYDFDITQTFVDDDIAHYTTVRPTSTQAPTTQARTTAAPTTAVPTSPPTTAVTTSTASSTTTSTTRLTTSTTSPSTSPSTTPTSTITTAPNDEDAGAPDELAATDDDGDGFPLWWVVLAFAAGGGIAAAVGSHLADKSAAVPDQ